MRGHVRLATLAAAILLAGTFPASAFHLYRNPSAGCSSLDGPTTDDTGASGPNGATVKLLHNLFLDSESNTNQTHVKVGESVTWTWNSSHCHSVTAPSFDSGFHYPTAPPDSPQAVPGVFEYPVLDDTPTLSFTHTFTAPGTYAYACVHHNIIGMSGAVVVEP